MKKMFRSSHSGLHKVSLILSISNHISKHMTRCGLHKSVAIVALSVLCLTLLTGCHGSKGLKKFEMPEEFDTSKNIEITFWAKNDTNKTQTEVYKKAIKDFEAIYPNITVNMKLYTDYARIYNDVITNISTQTTPNVCISYPDHIATYMTGINVVLPLDEIMNDSRYGLGGSEVKFDSPKVSEIVPEYLQEGFLADNYYALPYMRSTEALYINKTYVESLGYEIPDIVTWDFIWEVSEAATALNPDGTYLLNLGKVMIPFIYKSTDNMMITYLKQKNAGYSDDDGNIYMFNDTCTEFLEEIAGHASTGAFSTFKISGYPANFLNAGQSVFAIDSTGGATWMGYEAPNCDIDEDDLVEFELAVRPVPQVDITNPKMMSQGPSICIFNKEDPQVVLASWLFTQYLLTNDVQISYSQTEGYVPVTQKARDDERYIEYINNEGDDSSLYYYGKLEATRLLLNNTSNTFVTPVFNGSASLRNAAGAVIEDTVKGVKRGKKVDKSYIEQSYENNKSLYRLDNLQTKGIEKEDLGPLPSTAVILLWALAIAWVCIIVYFFVKKFKVRH